MATYLTLDARYGVTTFDPSNGFPVITEFSELIDDASIIPILEIASAQVPPVFILVSGYPITTPTEGIPANEFITNEDLQAAMLTVVRTVPQTLDDASATQARTNIDAEEEGGSVDLSKYVRVDAVQSFTTAEKTQGRSNIGAGTGGGGGGGSSVGRISVYDPAIGTVAIGDGVADDTAALNAAEAYSLANGFPVVDLGIGIYRITAPVQFSQGVIGDGGNESNACVIKCDSSTARVDFGYYQSNPALDTVHARVARGFKIDMNGKGDVTGRFSVYNVKGYILDVNVTDSTVTAGTTVSAMTPGDAVNYNASQNVIAIQLNASAVQGSALKIDNGAGGNKFDTCHFTTAGTLLRVTDTSPGSSTGNGGGFPFGPADNNFDNCIFETRLTDSLQLISIECGNMQVFTKCQFSVSTSTGVITSGALVNITGDIVFKGLTAPFQTHAAFGDGCSWNGGTKGASTGTNPVYGIAIDGAQVLDLYGAQYAQDLLAYVYNRAGSGTARMAYTGLVTGGGFGGKTAASAALSDSKQAISVGTGVTSYTLTFGAQTTSAIGPADTAASIQTKLRALSSIGAGNINVTGENGVYLAHFVGAKAGASQAAITTTPTGGTVTITAVQTGGVAASLTNYTNALNTLRVAGDFSRTVHYTPVAVAGLSFNADTSVYPEIQFSYVNSATNLTAFTLINPSDGQLFTITHIQSPQGESSYVWPSNCVFRGPTPKERAANAVLTVSFRYYKATDQWLEESRAGTRQIDLPYYAGSLQHNYDPKTGAYNCTGATMHAFRAALGKVMAGTSDMHMVFLGDSTLGGFDGSSYHYENNPVRTMAKAIAAKYGIPWQQGLQYIIGDKRTPLLGLADNWSATGSAAVQSIFLETTNVSTMTRAPLSGETGTSVDVFYSDLGSNGIAWKIDGVTQTVLPTSNTNTIRKVTVSGLANTTHTIEIDGAGAQIGIFVATRVYNPAVKALHVHNLSIGGSRANGGANDLNWSSTSSSGTYGIGYVMPALLTAAGITPDFVVVSIGGNDIANGTDAPTTLTGMDAMFNIYPTKPGLIMHAHKVSGVADATYNLLSKGKFEHADSLSKMMFNWDDWVGGLATAIADGLIGTDGTHPLTALQMLAGQELANILTK